MDAFELLKADHKKVAELFDLLETATGKRKLDVFKQIKLELDLHAHVEETIFYPALEKPDETHDLTLEAYEEHEVIKTLLAELAGARSADDEWQAKAKVLRENVEHHVDEEENELFDKADDALSDEEIERLGLRMEAEKARQQGRPAPKPAVAKNTSKKASNEPGILTRIAEFVGLGGKKSAKKPARKSPAKKQSAAKKSATNATRASNKTSSKKASKPSNKTVSKTASKRATTSTGAKRASATKSTSANKRGAGGSKKTAAKKR
ncbi:MAG TPA: hemerythrin domain-containing protein [Pyrinomonadaceae bacterium]|nr:hemerythrin domain-containing protein [Pyrinomonadaceae bacterium]